WGAVPDTARIFLKSNSKRRDDRARALDDRLEVPFHPGPERQPRDALAQRNGVAKIALRAPEFPARGRLVQWGKMRGDFDSRRRHSGDELLSEPGIIKDEMKNAAVVLDALGD